MQTERAARAPRALFWRGLMSLLAVALLGLAFAAQAQAASVPRAYAAVVIDAKSGKVLYSNAADSPRYPASITKVMTLYLLFQEIESGRMSLGTKMLVSKYAAAASPTKLGLKPGATITAEDAIKALVTKSANDVARVVAEHIGGSEKKFAQMMTETARALGMSRTTYRNASGLPDNAQVTTVRDQARLGMAIFQHFPQYYSYFKTKAFRYRGQTMGNHNRLLGVNGIDGIKTGYTRASGFNLLTSARSGDRHLVVAAFGFAQSGARDAKVRELVDKYLPQARKGSYWQQAQIARPGGRKGKSPVTAPGNGDDLVTPGLVIPMPRLASRMPIDAPDPRLVVAQRPVTLLPEGDTEEPGETQTSGQVAPMPLERPTELLAAPAQPVQQRRVNLADIAPEPARTAPRPLEALGQWVTDKLGLDPRGAQSGNGYAPPLPPAGVGAETKPLDLMTSGATERVASLPAANPMPAALPVPAGSGSWVVQIGAAPDEVGAQRLLKTASGKIDGLDGFSPYVERTEKSGQVFFRARFTGFTDRDAARAMCDRLKSAKMSCLAMPG